MLEKPIRWALVGTEWTLDLLTKRYPKGTTVAEIVGGRHRQILPTLPLRKRQRGKN